MFWKKIGSSIVYLVAVLALANVVTSTSLANEGSKKEKGHGGQQYNNNLPPLPSDISRIMSRMIKPPVNLVDIPNQPLLFNSGLPFKKMNKSVAWDKYICFINDRIACIDKEDPKKEAFLFDLFYGSFTLDKNEFVTDASADGNVLYVSTNEHIYKFTVNEGAVSKERLADVDAKAVTKYNGQYVYLQFNGNIGGVGLPTAIPKLNHIAFGLISDGLNLIVTAFDGVYMWKPGLSQWKVLLEGPFVTIPPSMNEKTHKLVMASSGWKNGTATIFKCDTAPDVTCSELAKSPVKKLALDGDKLYVIYNGGDLFWMDIGEDSQFQLNFLAPIPGSATDTSFGPLLVSDGKLYYGGSQGIYEFHEGGLGNYGTWSKISSPANSAVQGGRISADWNNDLYLTANGKLYRSTDGYSWSPLDAPSGLSDDSYLPYTPSISSSWTMSYFAAVDNFALVGSNNAVSTYNLADVQDGTTETPLEKQKFSKQIAALTAAEEQVDSSNSKLFMYVADVEGTVFKCPVKEDTPCEEFATDHEINQMVYLPANKNVLLCTSEGLFKLDMKAGLTSQAVDRPCNGIAVNGDKTFIMDMNGSVLQLNDMGNIEKSSCMNISPIQGGLFANGSNIYVGSKDLGVIKVFYYNMKEGDCLSRVEPLN